MGLVVGALASVEPGLKFGERVKVEQGLAEHR
jgi:hypothetical protein